MPHHATSLLLASVRTHTHKHTYHGQDQFLETRHALAAGQHMPGLKSEHLLEYFLQNASITLE